METKKQKTEASDSIEKILECAKGTLEKDDAIILINLVKENNLLAIQDFATKKELPEDFTANVLRILRCMDFFMMIFIALEQEFLVFKRCLTNHGYKTNLLTFSNAIVQEFYVGEARCGVCYLNDMGLTEMSGFVTRVVSKLTSCKFVTNIGISGSLNSEVKTGDVVIASTGVRWNARSKAVDAAIRISDNQELEVKTTFKYGKVGYTMTSNNLVYQYHTHYTEHFKKWQKACQDCAPIIKDLSSDSEKVKEILEGIIKDVGRAPKIHAGRTYSILSGDAVIKSDKVVHVLKQSADLKAVAVDMESGAVCEAVDGLSRKETEVIVVRSISDPANAEKTNIEEKTKDVNRLYAMYNATEWLLVLINALQSEMD